MLSTKHVVLGLVIERRGYGYELQQRVDSRFGFLGLSKRMIYRTIDRLREDGLIERVGVKDAGKTERGSPRVLYGPTEQGKDEFDRWMTKTCDLGVAREEVHVKVVLSQPPHLPRLVELTAELERTCLATMRELQAGDAPSFEQLVDPDLPWDTVAAVLAEDAECARLQAMIEWLQRVRVVVERRMEPPARRPVRR